MKNYSPSISVILCGYNAAETLPLTIDSLSNQSFSDFEVLAIDDGSTDDTFDVLCIYKACEPRLKILQNLGNRGIAFSRQRGLDESNSDLVMFIDADDIAEPNLIKRLYETISTDEKLIGVGCRATYFMDNERKLGTQCLGPESRLEFERIFRENKLLFMVPCTLFRKVDALAVGGYNQNVININSDIRYQDYSEDTDLWNRMADLGSKGRYFVTIPENLYRYRKSLNSLSTKNLFVNQLKMRWIKNSLHNRRSGRQELSLVEFVASRTNCQRVVDWFSDNAAMFFKRAGFSYANRNYFKLVFYLLLAALLSPKLIKQKIYTQKVYR